MHRKGPTGQEKGLTRFSEKRRFPDEECSYDSFSCRWDSPRAWPAQGCEPTIGCGRSTHSNTAGATIAGATSFGHKCYLYISSTVVVVAVLVVVVVVVVVAAVAVVRVVRIAVGVRVRVAAEALAGGEGE